MELRSTLFRMQIYEKLQKDLFLFYALEQTIFIRKREAANYFRLMTPSVDQSDSNELVTQRDLTGLRYRCLLIWLWETLLAMGKHFFRKLKYSQLGGSADLKSF